MIELKLSEQDAQVILIALSELKLKDGLNTFINIRSQLDKSKQVTPKETD